MKLQIVLEIIDERPSIIGCFLSIELASQHFSRCVQENASTVYSDKELGEFEAKKHWSTMNYSVHILESNFG